MNARSEAKNRLAARFLETIFNDRDIPAARAMCSDAFSHHEPSIAPGPDAFLADRADFARRHPDLRLEVVRQIADGDFVVTHCRRTGEAAEAAQIDILRFEDGRVAEYWHVFQPVPEKIANPNGMF